jgi:hypothetical protein
VSAAPNFLPQMPIIDDLRDLAPALESYEDWLPTLATAGDPNIKEKLAKGTDLNGRRYRNYIDGYNQLDHFSGKAKESPRKEFIYPNERRLAQSYYATSATEPLTPRRPCGTASGWHGRRAPGAPEARRRPRS